METIREIPKSVKIRDTGHGQVCAYYWRRYWTILIGVYGTWFIAFPILVCFVSHLCPNMRFLLEASPFLVVGVGILYWASAQVFNRTEMYVQNGILNLRQKPLPWPGSFSIPVSAIDKVQVEETKFGCGGLVGGQFRLVILAKDGRKRTLVCECPSYETLHFLARLLSASMGHRPPFRLIQKAPRPAPLPQKISSRKAVGSRSSLSTSLVLSILMFMGGALIIFCGLPEYLQDRERLGWPQVEGRIASVKISPAVAQSGPGKPGIIYQLEIQYQYGVGGKIYSGQRIDHNQWSMQYRTHDEARQASSALPTGGRVVVYYNPQEPAQALLKPSASGSMLVQGIVIITLGELAFVYVWIMRRKLIRITGRNLPWRDLLPFLPHHHGRLG